MSEAKFTKGPWAGFNNGKWPDCGAWSVNNDYASTYSDVAVNVGNVTICLVVSDSWNDVEMEANAYLIAAAPEMYEMLKMLIDDDAVECDYIDDICFLLAKVRGEK